MLAEIFHAVPFWSVVRASHVCHRWRAVALKSSGLWSRLSLNTSDCKNIGVVHNVLRRSGDRPMDLELIFHEPPAVYSQFRRLVAEVRPHLGRCSSLRIQAHEAGWKTILQAFSGETFSLLRSLDITSWNITTMPPVHPPASEPSHLVFPLPLNHPVAFVRLNGITLGETHHFPNLCELTVDTDFPHIVGADEQLSPWLINAAPVLSIQHMLVPPMDFPEDDVVLRPSHAQALVLRDLCATPRDMPNDEDSNEYDCSGFFCALHTPFLRYLLIEALDVTGRIWLDFFEALPADQDKFPVLEHFGLYEMHLDGIAYEDLTFFLGCMPCVRHIELRLCWPGTGQVLIETLELDVTLCPNLRGVHVDGAFLLRDDPFPFRHCANIF